MKYTYICHTDDFALNLTSNNINNIYKKLNNTFKYYLSPDDYKIFGDIIKSTEYKPEKFNLLINFVNEKFNINYQDLLVDFRIQNL